MLVFVTNGGMQRDVLEPVAQYYELQFN